MYWGMPEETSMMQSHQRSVQCGPQLKMDTSCTVWYPLHAKNRMSSLYFWRGRNAVDVEDDNNIKFNVPTISKRLLADWVNCHSFELECTCMCTHGNKIQVKEWIILSWLRTTYIPHNCPRNLYDNRGHGQLSSDVYHGYAWIHSLLPYYPRVAKVTPKCIHAHIVYHQDLVKCSDPDVPIRNHSTYTVEHHCIILYRMP